MRKAFTFVEACILALIVLTAVLFTVDANTDRSKDLHLGEDVRVKATKIIVKVMSDPSSDVLRCRVDNGEGAVPRYSDVSFTRGEVEKIVPAEAKP